jgi:hypothetical protein
MKGDNAHVKLNSRIVMAKTAFNKKKALFTSKLGLLLKVETQVATFGA